MMQGLLKLLWTVYSEGKLQSCLNLRNFQNLRISQVSIRHTMHKKTPKICICCKVSKAKYYLHKKGLKLAPVLELAKVLQ